MPNKKGNCFEKSAQAILDLNDDKDIHLVHGTAWSKVLKRRIEHAWVEIKDMIIDPEANAVFHAEKYYALGEIAIAAKYTRTEARAMLLKTENFGPWESQISGGKNAEN